ncbi:MAG: hypothetical protein Q7S21_07860 [archaeon]|nr:hypothetical protein [archaeon]
MRGENRKKLRHFVTRVKFHLTQHRARRLRRKVKELIGRKNS